MLLMKAWQIRQGLRHHRIHVYLAGRCVASAYRKATTRAKGVSMCSASRDVVANSLLCTTLQVTHVRLVVQTG